MSLGTFAAPSITAAAQSAAADAATSADHIERVFVINLARRTDRWEQFQRQLPSAWPFAAPERIDAIDGSLVTCPATWRSGGGAWGCYRSHLKILETCLNERVDSAFILEDDAVCCDDFSTSAEAFLNHLPPDWSLAYLGGQHLEYRRAPPLKVNDFVYRPFNVNRTHAWIIRGREMMTHVYHHLLSHSHWKSRHHIDHRLGELHKEHLPGIYVPHRWLVQQHEGASDINGGDHEQTDFPGAEYLAREQIEAPTVAVLAAPCAAAQALSLMLQDLGVVMGRRKRLASGSAKFDSGELREICDEMFAPPLFVRSAGRAACVRMLRRWAVMTGYHSREIGKLIGGYHPALCLLGPELLEAWPNTRFIVLSGTAGLASPNDQSQRYVTQLLNTARESFLSQYRPRSLRIDAELLEQNPIDVKRSVEAFLAIG
ncbi:MAG: glycosyltransferase family 25 protein [Planctomycetaceae bacterium]